MRNRLHEFLIASTQQVAQKRMRIWDRLQVEKNAGGIEGLCVITPTVHGDSRGYFMETYNQKDMEEAGLTMQFVQDNQSCFFKGCSARFTFSEAVPTGQTGTCH